MLSRWPHFYKKSNLSIGLTQSHPNSTFLPSGL